MLRTIPLLAALALGLGAAPALAEPVPPRAIAPEGSAAARTLEQNRRVFIGRPDAAASEARTPVARSGGSDGRAQAPAAPSADRLPFALLPAVPAAG